jgi:predicted RNA binding protein YcfA (HicA-like mRNA interferase family)
MVMHRPDPKARIVIPNHDPVRVGTLRQLIADAGLTVEQFLDLL